jgi:hypothetical protein
MIKVLKQMAKEVLLFSSGLSRKAYQEFINSFQSYSSDKQKTSSPFVFVDKNSIKFLADVLPTENVSASSVFAISVDEKGWMELLALYE